MRKRLSLLMLLVFTMTLCMPFEAMASSDKSLFVNNLNEIYKQQIKFEMDKPVSGELTIQASLEGETLPPELQGFRSIDGKVSYQLDMEKELAALKLTGKLDAADPKSLDMNIFIQKDQVIIPVSDLKKISPEKEFPAGIEYVYTNMEGFSFNELKEALDSQNTDVVMNLVNLIYSVVPDQQFSSRGDTAILTLDKAAVITIAEKFKDPQFVDSFAEGFTALSPGLSKEDMVEALGAAKDVSFVDLFRNLKVNQIKEELSKDRVNSIFDIAYQDETVDLSVKADAQAAMQAGQMSSTANALIDIKPLSAEGADRINLDFRVNEHYTQEKISSNAAFKAYLCIEGKEVKVKGQFDLQQREDLNVKINVPALTEKNSMLMENDSLDVDYLIEMDEMPLFLENEAYIEKGVTMVPLREMGDYLDYSVEWQAPRQILVNNEDLKLSFTVAEAKYLSNGSAKNMGTALQVRDGVTYVPLRALAQELGYELSYDAEKGIVCMNSAVEE